MSLASLILFFVFSLLLAFWLTNDNLGQKIKDYMQMVWDKIKGIIKP